MENMASQIGFLANDIIALLGDCGESSVLTIKSKLNVSNTMAFLAIGWLSREGKVYIRKEGDDFLVGIERNEHL